MARNGSGTYSLYTPGNPVVTGTTISSTWANNTLNDIATALTNSVAKNGETTLTGNLPMGTFKLTGLGVGTVNTDSITLGQAQNEGYQLIASVAGTNTITGSLSPAITAYAAGQTFRFVAAASNTGAVTININSLGAKSITKDGTTALSTGDILINGLYEITYDGTQFQLKNSSVGFTGGTVANATTFSSTVGFSADTTMTGATAKWAKGADVASATALPLITDGNYFDVTGTTTITSFNSVGVGTWVGLHFDGALTLTHQATDLILPGGANITTAAGDEAIFVEYASGDWRCVSYTKANGTSVVGGITTRTATATTSGTTHDYTSIPSTVKRITAMFSGISTNGTSQLLLQLGDSGGIEPTGYLGSVMNTTSQFIHNTGFEITGTNTAASVWYGMVILDLLDSATNTWAASINVGSAAGGLLACGGGTKALSATLDRVRLTATNGTDTFDAGLFNISYE